MHKLFPTMRRQRMTRTKSLYSREKMRQHRVRHQRVLRLRKTDYTAGHLLAAATASRHWGGGDSCDEGFSYSFEERRHSHSHRHRKANTIPSPSTSTSRIARRSSTATRGTSHSPARSSYSHSVSKGMGGGGISGRGTRSAPRLPSLLDVDDIYGGGSILGSPNLEQCLQAAEVSARRGGGGGGGGGTGSRASSSRTSAVGSGNREDDAPRFRPSTDGSIGSRGGSRQHRKSSLHHHRGGKDAAGAGSSTGAARGTDASLDSLSHRGGGFLGDDSPGGTRGGRYGGRRGKGAGGGRGEKNASSSGSDGIAGNDADLDRIFNPLAFLDEEQGVRVLIQATKPLEVGVLL